LNSTLAFSKSWESNRDHEGESGRGINLP
jgi:hypothetical protein